VIFSGFFQEINVFFCFFLAEGNKEMLALLIERCGKEKVNLRDPRGRSAVFI